MAHSPKDRIGSLGLSYDAERSQESIDSSRHLRRQNRVNLSAIGLNGSLDHARVPVNTREISTANPRFAPSEAHATFSRSQELSEPFVSTPNINTTQDKRAMTDPQIGSTVSHYKILEKIGQGGMGVIYRAEDTKLKRTVALKFLPPDRTRDEEAKERFLKEARVASAIDHPNICNIHEVGETPEGQMYIVMAYYQGQSLKDLVHGDDSGKTAQPLEIKRVTELAIEIAGGLARAHQSGIVHRDIKPSNIMITEFEEAKIVDFGLAKLTTGDMMTRSDRITGTVAFMSPEQVQGKPVDFRTDIWSFGVVLYEMVTGHLPFDEEYPQATMYSIVSRDPKSPTALNDNIPLGMATIIGNCLRKDRDERYASTEALVSDLRQLQRALDSGTADSLAETVELPRSESAMSRRPHGVVVRAVVFAALICLIWFFAPVKQRFDNSTPRQLTEHHLAVLPIRVSGGDEAQRAFCDGLTEHLVSRISQFESPDTSFWVVPTSEIRRNEIVSATEARTAFGVNLVLEGALHVADDQLSLTLNLVDPEAVRILESTDVEDEFVNLPALQDKTVNALANMLGLASKSSPISGGQGGSLVPGAMEYYLQALGYLQQSYKDPSAVDIAMELLYRAISEDSSYAQALAGLAKAHVRKYELEKNPEYLDLAQLHCARAIDHNDQMPEAFVVAGEIHIKKGEFDQAITAIDKALELAPSNVEAVIAKARALEAMKQTNAAEKTYKRAISLRRDYWPTYDRLGIFYFRQGLYEDAATQFSHVVRLTPDYPNGYRNLGAVYFYQGLWNEAREVFEKSVSIAPDFRTYANLGTLYFYERRYSEAAEAYQNALAISDGDYRTWSALGDAHTWISGHDDQAVAAYERGISLAKNAVETNPEDFEAWAELAGMYANLKRETEARAALNMVTESRNPNQDVAFRVAHIYEQLGEREIALRWFEKLMKAGYPMPGFDQNPWMQAIREDNRFQLLLQKYGISE